MAQTNPSYLYATGKCEKPIIDALVQKYGASNISWPIVLLENDRTAAYLYEYNGKNQLNHLMDSRPGSRSKVPSYFLNYAGRRWAEPAEPFLADFLRQPYSCSYDYILDPSSPYSSVDLDYVWYNGRNYKGFELTTFYVPFSSSEKALNLISKMNRRPSWKGENGARAFHRIIDSAEDLGVDYYIVCANTVSRSIGSELETNGNVCLFRLTHDQVNLLEKGKKPENSEFMTFQQFLDWL